VLTLTNVTAFRARIEHATYEREFAKTVLNTTSEPLVILDADLRVQTANRAFYEKFAMSREETQGVPLGDLPNHPWDNSELWALLNGALFDKRRSQPLELDHDFPVIGRRRLLLDARRLSRKGDAEHLILVSLKDISERKQAEEQLRRLAEERQQRQIADAIPNTIQVLSPEGAVLYANQAVIEYTGLTMDDVMAIDFRARVFHPEDAARLEDERQKGLLRGVAFDNELRVRGKDGQYRWFLVRYRPVHDERGRILRWYATGTDIDDRKHAEERMRNENLALREAIDHASMFEEIVGSSDSLRRVLAQVGKVAPTDSTVFILGETGTGKELVARAIHKRSRRSSRAFIRVNCSAIPQSLIASELFGHEKGAFTGAAQRRLGRFESADGGTIFLDEVGELPAETQVALLRVLQESEIERVGSSRSIPVDVRILAATNRNIEEAVERGTFRQDLYYRLNVFPIRIPPLRERTDDIPLLAGYLVQRCANKAGKRIRHIDKRTMELLQAYGWPGNVRELRNVIERAVVLCEEEMFFIDESWLQTGTDRPPGPTARLATTLVGHEKELIEAALADSHGRVSGPSGAAEKLGVPRQTLDSRIKALHVDKLRFRPR
jgi:formate hydrogenlyase transcriptional activator